MKPDRVSTYDLMLSLDHVIRLVHNPRGLVGFQYDDEDAESPPRPDFITAKTLVLASDNGSDANAMKWFVCHHLKLRVLNLYDPRHKCQRILVNTMNHCGYQTASGYARILISWTRGPWDNRKWFRVVAEESAEFLKMIGPAHEHSAGVSVIKYMLPRIAAEGGLVEHEVSVNDAVTWLKEAKFYKEQAASGEPSRWDEFHATWRCLRHEIALLTVVLVSYGLKNGLIQMNGEHPAVSQSLVKAAEQAGVSENLKAGQKERRVIYSKFKNKLQAVLYLLLDNDLLASINSWFTVSNPVSLYLNDMRRDVRGRQGSWEFWQRQAEGQWRGTLNKIVEAALDQQCHAHIGIANTAEVQGSMYFYTLTADSAIVQFQDWLFERLVHYALTLMRFMCIYELLT